MNKSSFFRGVAVSFLLLAIYATGAYAQMQDNPSGATETVILK